MSEFFKDKNLLFLALNVFLVIFGYGLASLTDMESNAIILPLKAGVLLFSLFNLLKSNAINKSIKINENALCYIFILSLLLSCLFSFDILQSVLRGATFIIPFLYVHLIITYIRTGWGIEKGKNALLQLFHFIYLLPIISFYLFGGSLEESDIYGDEIGAFVSNHYGWSCMVYLLTFYDLWSNKLIGNRYKIIGLILSMLALNLLIISGNRASYLGILIAALVIIFFNKRIHFSLKLLIPAVFYLAFSFMISDENSSFSKRFEKTIIQLENAEENYDTRTTARQAGFYMFDRYPELSLTGVGLFNFREAINYYLPEIPSSHYRSGIHNSYLEIFFGGGILIFSYFFIFYIFFPLKNYFRYLSDSLLFPIPILILPFFESNLTGGQFLFFPWFLTILLLRNYMPSNKPKLKPIR